MKLRELKKKDALFMLEWMHNKEITRDLLTDFSSKTINDCLRFIENSKGRKQLFLKMERSPSCLSNLGFFLLTSQWYHSDFETKFLI